MRRADGAAGFGEAPGYGRPWWRADLQHTKHLCGVRWGQERARDRDPGLGCPAEVRAAGMLFSTVLSGQVERLFYTILTSSVSLCWPQKDLTILHEAPKALFAAHPSPWESEHREGDKCPKGRSSTRLGVEPPLCPDQKLQEREPLGPGSEKWDPGLGVPCDAGGPERRATRDGRWVAVA